MVISLVPYSSDRANTNFKRRKRFIKGGMLVYTSSDEENDFETSNRDPNTESLIFGSSMSFKYNYLESPTRSDSDLAFTRKIIRRRRLKSVRDSPEKSSLDKDLKHQNDSNMTLSTKEYLNNQQSSIAESNELIIKETQSSDEEVVDTHIEEEDQALENCLSIAKQMKSAIINFLGGSENNEFKEDIEAKISNGRCSITRINEYIKKKELWRYIATEESELLENLKEYQVIGIMWLLSLHKNNYNGILADEMGLGKTAQACVLLQYLFKSIGMVKPVIICCPASLLDNWARELKTWSPKLRFEKYHGPQKERKYLANRLLELYDEHNVNVIITTFQVLTNKTDVSLFFKHCEFSYLIVDEAHNIKNPSSQRYKFMNTKIRADRRLLLTGTPISNSVSELGNLLAFLMPKFFSQDILSDAIKSYKRRLLRYKEYEDTSKLPNLISESLDTPVGITNSSEILFLQEIISPFVLRRTKQDVLSLLPKKTVYIEFCDLTEKQLQQYQSQFANASINVNNEQIKNTSQLEFSKYLSLEIEKKVTKNVYTMGNNHEGIDLSDYNKTRDSLLDQIHVGRCHPKIGSSDSKELNIDGNSLLASSSYDPKYVNSILFRLRRICNHPLLHQGHFKKEEIDDLISYLNKNIQGYKEYPRSRVEQYIKQLCDYEIHQLALENSRNSNTNFFDKYLIKDELVLGDSCKVIKMYQIIEKKVIRKEKCLVFCHHTMLLDIVEEYIKLKFGDKTDFYIRLDGTTPIDTRQKLVEQFQTSSSTLIFLLSTKAAGQGLNLTAASTVIMMDIDYNPQIERQAEDRVHRLGQSKDVSIFKLICRNSIEEDILKCCESKLSLDAAFGGSETIYLKDR
ncbi:Snf2 Rad54 helicase family protein [Cryptosporidium andersoni]|uniref:Snf2 Rad54 helicase family protein n=1 Tax=Cryptosporidium andersoni TaxID=117008 RepID=A0A1J4MBA9_9CRYT|nr:Snf2 Rad54 helicase family protein [Cryptosporidium andersoni]